MPASIAPMQGPLPNGVAPEFEGGPEIAFPPLNGNGRPPVMDGRTSPEKPGFTAAERVIDEPMQDETEPEEDQVEDSAEGDGY
jgi:hypothetical protein